MKAVNRLNFTTQLYVLIFLVLIWNNSLLAETIPLKVATVCMNVVPDKQVNLQKIFL